MVNLLPEKANRTLYILYYSRLGTLVFFSFALVILVGVVLTLPSYFLARAAAGGATQYLASAEGKTVVEHQENFKNSIALLQEQVDILKKFQHEPLTAVILSRVTSDTSEAVSVNRITLTLNNAMEGQATVSGIAKTRAALLEFASRLQSEKIFKGVSVPVSDLTTDSDITFSLPFAFSTKTP